MAGQQGSFVISLDFELYWGVRDSRPLLSYQENILGVRSVIPRLLELFEQYQIHATWATVGFLFFEQKTELLKGLPKQKPDYQNRQLSPYDYLTKLGSNEQADRFHYAASLIRTIKSQSNQEIGTHTFSHYYCLELGQTIETFREDLEAAIKIAKQYQLPLKSLVFPRNQFNSSYLEVCRQKGIQAYRGNESSWIYSARSQAEESLFRRAIRLIDAYINLSGHNSYSVEQVSSSFPFNIPASRLLRPYSKRLKFLEPLRRKRILSDMTYAAKNGLIYHLWWHPHNFGTNTEKNLEFLQQILLHYLRLREDFGMESLNMGELSERLVEKLDSTRLNCLSSDRNIK